MGNWSPLGAVPPYPVDRYAGLADRIAGILRTSGDVVFVQAEAIVALEAVAESVARPGRRVLVAVTSPYGDSFGGWLERAGSDVRYLRSEGIAPIQADALASELSRHPAEVVCITHGEAATGVVNPLQELAGVARSHGALVVVDAVASVGGHPLHVDAWGIDIAVIGAQKSLGGPASLSAVSVSGPAWRLIEARGTGDPARLADTPGRTVPGAGPDARDGGDRPNRVEPTSVLSLLDLRRGWLDAGRTAPPGMPDPLAFWAMDAAVEAVLAEGLDALIERHARASALARSAVRALGSGGGATRAIRPMPEADDAASRLVTLAPVPEGVSRHELLAIARTVDETVSPAHGASAGDLVRLNHTGARASRAAVATSVLAYATALRRLGVPVDVNAAADVLAR